MGLVARNISHCATQRFLHGWKYPHPRPAQGTVISMNQSPPIWNEGYFHRHFEPGKVVLH